MKINLIAVIILCLAASGCSIIDADGDNVRKSKKASDTETCPVCGEPEEKPEHHDNGHHYGQHKHQPPKANG